MRRAMWRGTATVGVLRWARDCADAGAGAMLGWASDLRLQWYLRTLSWSLLALEKAERVPYWAACAILLDHEPH